MPHTMTEHGVINPSIGGFGSSTGIDSESRPKCGGGAGFYDEQCVYEYPEASERRHDSVTVIRLP